MNVNDYKFIMVLFPPGAGGNHLANLISTSPYVANRTNNITDYNDSIKKYYSSNTRNAHINSTIQNVGVFDTANVIDIVSKV